MDDEKAQVLSRHPDDFCLYCEMLTPFDGWAMGEGGLVEFFCDRCGHIKYAVPFKEIYDMELKTEILGLMNDA